MLSVRLQLLSSYNSISDFRNKIVRNANFSSVNQNSDLSIKLNSTREHKSRGILGFQNRAPDIKLVKFHENWDNNAYLKKFNFQRKLIYQFWNFHWIHSVKTSLSVVSDPISSSSWSYTQNKINLKWHFSQLS